MCLLTSLYIGTIHNFGALFDFDTFVNETQDDTQKKIDNGANNLNTEAENRDLLIAGELLSSLNNKIIIERNYLPRDVINERHVLQVFNNYEYKNDLINKEIQSIQIQR